MSNNLNDIDFVMLWVDGSDPEWREQKAFYEKSNSAESIDSSEARYRDWDILKYWFRGVEKFAPWVNHIYFVTCGHVPEWLNLDNPKLIHVKHQDYMPAEYLPTFNSHPIELNIHRIQGLAEKIVYWNDDLFITRPIKPELFFQNDLPVHPARLHGILPRDDGGVMPHVYVNIVSTINKHFNMKKQLKENVEKWISPRTHDIRDIIDNIYNSRYAQFPGFGNEHLAVPMLKSTIETIWSLEPALLDETSRRKFRSSNDVSQFLFRYWDLASGQFCAIKNSKLGKRYSLVNHNDELYKAISEQKYNLICCNDMGTVDENYFEEVKRKLINSFETVFPEKSSFE